MDTLQWNTFDYRVSNLCNFKCMCGEPVLLGGGKEKA